MKRKWNTPVVETVATAETEFNTNGDTGDNGWTHVLNVDTGEVVSVGPNT